MSFVSSVADASGTPVITAVACGGVARRRWAERPRSIYRAPIGPSPVIATGVLAFTIAASLARALAVPTYTTADGQVLPATLVEKARSRTLSSDGDGMKFSRSFYVFGSSDPVAVRDMGPQVGDADDVLLDFTVDDRKANTYATGGEDSNAVLIVCTYSRPGQPKGNGEGQEPTLAYEFGSESEHIDRALNQVHYGGDGVRVGDLINVTDQEVQGLDINAPILEVTEEHYFGETEFGPSIRRTLRDQVQKVNMSGFREWEAGEVLFVGASARKQGKIWAVTFNFRVRRNVTNLAITTYSKSGVAQEQSIVKAGWSYLWIESIKILSADTLTVRVVPYSVHVAQVYERIDFSVFGIGSNPIP